jgi:type IV secretory pathway VirB10-like protein
VGCPILAEHDLVIVKDPTKAKSIREEFKARPQPHRRAPCGQHVKKGGSDNPPPPPPPPNNQAAGAPATENPSARRATSAEPSPRLSPPPNIPASGFEDDNYWARSSCDYFDGDDVPSDTDDGEAFQYDWADVPYSDEPAAEETKTNADFSHYFITASARCTTAKHVSAALTSVAYKALKSPQTIISKPVNLGVQCCANSGATDHMFPDRHAFISLITTLPTALSS